MAFTCSYENWCSLESLQNTQFLLHEENTFGCLYLGWYNAEFLNFGIIDILGWIILCCGKWHVYCGMFSSIPGLYSLTPLASLSLLWQPDIVKCTLGDKTTQFKITNAMERSQPLVLVRTRFKSLFCCGCILSKLFNYSRLRLITNTWHICCKG